MTRLSGATAARLPAAVARPGYDRNAQAVGIVHIGLGAFARAHPAVYTDDAMAAGDRDWAIMGVSLRSTGARDALAPQDGLYTVTERSAGGDAVRLVGALRDAVVAAERPAALAALLADPRVRVATLTVTEKAYALGPDGVLGPLADALAARHAAGAGGLTLVSCDNLADNGGVLSRGLSERLDRSDPAVARWFAAECACPATMVDRIVPAVTGDDLDGVEAAIGLRDEGAIVTEAYRQWVIEDRFAGPRPRWEAAGASIVADIAAFEQAKLRMLNGAHSALAYLGLHAGHAFVHEAIADPRIGALVETLMRDEAAMSLAPAAGQDPSAYADALIARFRNPRLLHRLAQIASDGSQKIVQRWLTPMAINAAQGRPSPATLRALAAWLIHVRDDGAPVVDPLAAMLSDAWQKAGTDGIVEAVLGERGLIASPWRATAADQAALRRLVSEAG